MIGQQYFGPYLKNQNFAWYGIDAKRSISIVFILDYFQESLKTKFFKKSKKKTYFGAIYIFSQIWAKMIFFWRKGLSVFKYSNNPPSCKKSGKCNRPFLIKMPNWQMGIQNRWTDKKCYFTGPSVGQGSKMSPIILSWYIFYASENNRILEKI